MHFHLKLSPRISSWTFAAAEHKALVSHFAILTRAAEIDVHRFYTAFVAPSDPHASGHRRTEFLNLFARLRPIIIKTYPA